MGLTYMGVEPKIGVFPPKWMVKIMEKPMAKWDDFGGKTPLFSVVDLSMVFFLRF